MLKKLLKGLISASMVLSMAVTSVAASETGVAKGTQTPYVTGDDWGCPVTATVIKLDKTIDAGSVAKTDFVVQETKVSTTKERTVIDAYVSDARGNKVETNSEYVTIQFASDPTDGAFSFDVASFTNNWATPYALDVQLVEGQDLASNGETINTLDITADITLSNSTIICPQLEKFALKQYTTTDGTVLDYAIYTPAQDNHKNALVIWNHGAGERGADASIPLLGNEASNLAQPEFQNKFGGAYVIAIQTGTGYTADKALELIKATIAGNPDIDPNRVIVGGCSMGGGNTISMIKAEPTLFAAAYPICAAGDISEEEAVALKDLPIWFLCAQNDASLYERSKVSAANLRAAGNTNVHEVYPETVVDTTGRFTKEDGTTYEYPGHWSWTYFFNNKVNEGDLNEWDWLAQQVRVPVVTATGTQKVVVTGDDWGCGVSKAIVTLDMPIDAASISVEDFNVVEEKPWYGTAKAQFTRKVIAAYPCDANGNKVEGASATIALELYISPSEGSPMLYSGGRNNWVSFYNNYITLAPNATLTSGENTINTLDIDPVIENISQDRICPQVDKFAIGEYTDSEGGKVSYALYTPTTDNHKNALVIWNHGAGEYGTDVQIDLLCNEVTAYAGDEFQEIMDGAYVLVPQRRRGGDDTSTTLTVAELIKKVLAENPDIDPNRVIETGCSAGGAFTLSLEIDYPELIAAAAPICPAKTITDEEAAKIKDIPNWFIHAINDPTVKVNSSNVGIEKLKAQGTEVHMSLFDDVHDTTGRFTTEDGEPYQYAGHWSWIYADNNECYCDECEDLNCWEWMAQQSKVSTSVATGTQKVVVTGDDWGCGVSKAVVTLDKVIDAASISAEDFYVVEEKPWYGTPKAQFTRKVLAAYPCDEAGNKIEGSSNIIAVELYISPSEGSPMIYTGRNNWVSFYNNYVMLAGGQTLTSGDDVITELNVDPVIENIGKDRLCPQLDGYVIDEFTDSKGGKVSYALYAPATDNHKNALVIWNHGAGEYGTDVQIDLLCNEVTAYSGEEFQAIMDGAYVLVPQRRWGGEDSSTTLTVAELIKKVLAENPDIDPTRVIETGCSAGGMFTLQLEIDYPELIAAAAPICPAKTITEAEAAIIKDIPNWFVHAINDPTVKVNSSNVGIALLKAQGSEVHMSLFDDVHDTTGRFTTEDGEPYQYAGHWSWIYADNNECYCDECEDLNMWEWMAQQQQDIETVKGTQTIYVNGYDWGPATDKTIIALESAVDAVDAKDFYAQDYRAYINWAGNPTVPEVGAITRTIKAVYLSDAEGNKVEGASKYITVELVVDPSNGDPFNYSIVTGFNSWADPYQVQINGRATVNGQPVDLDVADGTYENMITSVDHLIEDKMEISGKTYDYSYYQPETEGAKGLMIWLHGAGEGGHTPNLVTLGNYAAVWAEEEFLAQANDCYVLYPQCPTMWMDQGNGNYPKATDTDIKGIYVEDLMTLIENFCAAHPDIDKDHIVIGGCSNGGYMTMNMILHYPEYFAAAYPTCEAYYDNAITDAELEAIKDMPIWFTHAKNDTTVDPTITSVATYERLIKMGAKNVHFTFFDDVHDTSGLYEDAPGVAHQYAGHWSWIYLFNDDAKYEETLEGGIHAFLAKYLVVEAKEEPTPDKPADGGNTGGNTGGTTGGNTSGGTTGGNTSGTTSPSVGIYNNAAYAAVAGLALAAAGFVALKKKKED